MTPPRPVSNERRGSLLRLARAFRHDLLSALPERFHRAWMAEFRAPFLHSFVCNDPDLVALILRGDPKDFPKSNRLREGLAPLLGHSIFVTNGEEWAHQRRIIDPAFEGGRLRDTFPAIRDAALALEARLKTRAGQEIDIEPEASHAASDAIFRTLFSLPIEHQIASRVFAAFRAHQDAQPIVNLAGLVPLPRWLPRPHSRRTRRTAATIRDLIRHLVAERLEAIARGTAPDDLATKIMTTPDPQTGACFDRDEMVDQVAIFFLAGHETSAAALSWSLWLLASAPEWQAKVAAEAASLPAIPDFSDLSGLPVTRAVFREAMRLYPPVPMLVREAAGPHIFRQRPVPKGAQLIVSPWHLHRHERLWQAPHDFDPARWETENGRAMMRRAYFPFSAGPRVCPGAGFAMIEGVLMIALAVRAARLETADTPVPVARLTLRGRDGIRLRLHARN